MFRHNKIKVESKVIKFEVRKIFYVLGDNECKDVL